MEIAELSGNQQQYSSDSVSFLGDNVLKGKKVLFLGSSVTYGECSLQDGIPEYFAKRLECSSTKEAVSGTTLVDVDENSYVNRLKTRVDTAIPYDLVVCQLSTNDATQQKPLGTMEETKEISAFDTSTVTGALEYIIAYAKEKWNCPVAVYTGSHYDSKEYDAMVGRLYELSEKWDLIILDLWKDKEFNAIADEKRSLYMNDPVHPTKAGYMKWWCPELERQLLKQWK